MNMQKKGFTLVELSIVLVIIGLLIGGILAAQSMIGTAKIQGLIRQAGQFDAAEANFETKYGQIPGDNNLMGNALGNNNGRIEGSYVNANWGGEIGKYWSDLSASGIANPNGSAYIDNSANASSNITVNTSNLIPTAVAGNKAFFLIFGTSNNNNYYFVCTPTSGGYVAGINNNPSFTPTETLAVDSKIDDGNASTGNVIGTEKTYYASFSSTPVGAAGNCTIDGSVYKTANTATGCSLAIRIGTSTGNLK